MDNGGSGRCRPVPLQSTGSEGTQEGATKIMSDNSSNTTADNNPQDNSGNNAPEWYSKPPEWYTNPPQHTPPQNNPSDSNAGNSQRGYGPDILAVLQGLPEQLANVIKEMNPAPAATGGEKQEEKSEEKTKEKTTEPGSRRSFADRWFN